MGDLMEWATTMALRRLAGSPIKGEHYPSARIAAGPTGLDQPPPAREFD